jgi:alpha-glucosidase
MRHRLAGEQGTDDIGAFAEPGITLGLPAQARVAAMLLLTLRGTPTIYQGEEIGLTDVPIPPERVQDPWERRVPGLGLGRDPVRTPMQWDAGAGAGFTSAAEPWLPLAEDWPSVNVASQGKDAASMLSLYQALLALRRAEPALSVGAYASVATGEDEVLAYERRDEATGRRLSIVLNLGNRPREAVGFAPGARVLLSTRLNRSGEAIRGTVRLGPDEGVVVELGSTAGTRTEA